MAPLKGPTTGWPESPSHHVARENPNVSNFRWIAVQRYCPPDVASVRVGQPCSNNEGSPSDLKYEIGSPTEWANAFAKYQGPSPPPSVLHASRRRTQFRHCRQRWRGVIQRSRNRTERVSLGSPFSCDRGAPQATKTPGILWTLSLRSPFPCHQ